MHLSAFFRWVSTELNILNLMKGVSAPRFEEAPVEPFTREEVEALLKACEYCQLAKTADRRRPGIDKLEFVRPHRAAFEIKVPHEASPSWCKFRHTDPLK